MSESKKLGVGIVGCGHISEIHAQAVKQSKGLELVSVYSRSEEKAERFGAKHGITGFSNLEQFLADANLHAVAICTASGAHLEYGLAAAKAGKHVIVEKPIEVTLERAKALINVCEVNGVELAVIYQNRFLPDVIEMKKRLDAGELGKIFMGDAYVKWNRSQEYYDSGAWRGTLALDGGGVLINQAIHTIDLLQWMMGDVQSVFGQIGTFTHERLEGEDNAVAVLRFESDAIGVIQGSTSVQPPMTRRLEIHGEKGSAILNGDHLEFKTTAEQVSSPDLPDKTSTGAGSPFQDFVAAPHVRQFEAIAKAIQKNEQPPVSGRESLKSLAIVLAIYQSSSTDEIIKLVDLLKS